MYKGFNLALQDADFIRYEQEWHSIGIEMYENYKAIVKTKLSDFALDSSGKLDGTAMQNNWFPQIETDIFISHSHRDKKLAICLAGWLFQTFKIKSFIDSCVWGYSDDLLKIIDEKYCYNEYLRTYDYEKRNYSTSHVHMMLSTALTMMIDKSECLFFINTPNSLTVSDVINNKTSSPWIYSEITISNLIQKKGPIRQEILRKSKTSSLFENLLVDYNVDLSHMEDMDSKILNRWNSKYFKEKDIDKPKFKIILHPLDYLYDLYGYAETYYQEINY